MFENARVKLTIWYVFILMLVSCSFSVIIYKALTLEVNRFAKMQQNRIENRLFLDDPTLPPGRGRMIIMVDDELINETKRRIVGNLLIINGVLFVVSTGMAYGLAGRTLRPIKEMIDEQNRFISDASHELKTPLTSLKSAFEVYLRDKKPTVNDAKELISESITEVDSMDKLAASLLTLAKFEQPSEIRKEKVSLKTIAAKAIKKVKAKAELRKISINQDLGEVQIVGEECSLTELVVILLDNAIKYSKTNGQIEIRTFGEDGAAVIEVKDNGIGIAKKDIPYLFKRFYRADKARSRNENGGFGLGLAILQKIADNHKAKIEIASVENEGSTFRVIFSANIKKQ